jgi:hypothetical protein
MIDAFCLYIFNKNMKVMHNPDRIFSVITKCISARSV